MYKDVWFNGHNYFVQYIDVDTTKKVIPMSNIFLLQIMSVSREEKKHVYHCKHPNDNFRMLLSQTSSVSKIRKRAV